MPDFPDRTGFTDRSAFTGRAGSPAGLAGMAGFGDRSADPDPAALIVVSGTAGGLPDAVPPVPPSASPQIMIQAAKLRGCKVGMLVLILRVSEK